MMSYEYVTLQNCTPMLTKLYYLYLHILVMIEILVIGNFDEYYLLLFWIILYNNILLYNTIQYYTVILYSIITLLWVLFISLLTNDFQQSVIL